MVIPFILQKEEIRKNMGWKIPRNIKLGEVAMLNIIAIILILFLALSCVLQVRDEFRNKRGRR
jgi:hypothetical protein